LSAAEGAAAAAEGTDERTTKRGVQPKMRKGLRYAASVLAMGLGLGLATEAFATEGYFQHAYGLRHKALAGAGAASIEDATGISINPAGLVGIGDQFNMGLSLFMPTRWYKALGAGQAAVGKHTSSKDVFPVPTLAYVRQLDSSSAIAFSIFGNGGMNTTYSLVNHGAPCPGATGILCGTGKTGVDLMQMFISAAYARKFGNFSIGIAPIFAIQRFKAYGLQAFAGFSTNNNNLTNRGYSYSYGGGVRIGFNIKPVEWISIGASYQTKMWMSRFKKYSGLFAERGDFDIPANLQVGVAFQLSPDIKLMLDYRRIFYSDVKSISNPMQAILSGARLGANNGPGFNWGDTNTIKVGLEYQATNNLILRAGYSYMWPQVMDKEAVLFNILAPGVIRHQITGGATYRINQNNDIDFAFMIAPTSKIQATTPAAFGGQNVELKMYQFEVSLGWTYNFGAGSARAR
jgi:long-chain fatty acid transport protein